MNKYAGTQSEKKPDDRIWGESEARNKHSLPPWPKKQGFEADRSTVFEKTADTRKRTCQLWFRS